MQQRAPRFVSPQLAPEACTQTFISGPLLDPPPPVAAPEVSYRSTASAVPDRVHNKVRFQALMAHKKKRGLESPRHHNFLITAGTPTDRSSNRKRSEPTPARIRQTSTDSRWSPPTIRRQIFRPAHSSANHFQSFRTPRCTTRSDLAIHPSTSTVRRCTSTGRCSIRRGSSTFRRTSRHPHSESGRSSATRAGQGDSLSPESPASRSSQLLRRKSPIQRRESMSVSIARTPTDRSYPQLCRRIHQDRKSTRLNSSHVRISY